MYHLVSELYILDESYRQAQLFGIYHRRFYASPSNYLNDGHFNLKFAKAIIMKLLHSSNGHFLWVVEEEISIRSGQEFGKKSKNIFNVFANNI